MKVLGAFIKKDGTSTPAFTVDEIKNKEYRKYGITDRDFDLIFLRLYKALLKIEFPNLEIEIKEEEYVQILEA